MAASRAVIGLVRFAASIPVADPECVLSRPLRNRQFSVACIGTSNRNRLTRKAD